MQFGSTTHHAILEIANDDRAVIGAFFGVTFDEAVVHEAMKAVMTAGAVEPQKVIPQQRQFLLLAENPNGALDRALIRALGTARNGTLVVHSHNSSWWPSRRRRIPR